MDPQRFDAFARALGAAGSRRGAISAIVGSALGIAALGASDFPDDTAARKRKKKRKRRKRNKNTKKVKGPCAPGKSKKNSCKKDKQCCTGNCKKGKKATRGRCRCRKVNQSCTEQRNCCPEQGRGCFDSACQLCDVCPSGCPFTDVQAAIDAAPAGATIRVCAGTFPENLIIDKDLTLLGIGAEQTILDGAAADRVLRVVAGKTVTVQGLTVTGGVGGIFNAGELILRAVVVSGNDAGIGIGGGILNFTDGTLTLQSGCRISGNTANGGGGIFNQAGTVSLETGSVVSGNTAGDDGGGIFNSQGTLTLNASTVSGNEASSGDGGGILNFLNSDLTLIASTVSGNTAGSEGGGIYNFAGGTVNLDTASHVCENSPDQCFGFIDPACTPACPG